jgi:peptide/nickel transport system permease protein
MIRDRLGLFLAVLVLCAAVGAPFISRFDPAAQSATDRLLPPDAVHLMGRDTFGRDVFTRVLYGARVSLMVAVGSVLLGGVLGTLLGLTAGYGGNRVEQPLMRALDAVMAFPSLLLGLALLTVLGVGLDKMILAIGVVLVPTFARITHAATLSVKTREFIEAARCLGAGRIRIVGHHILPAVLGETIVLASLQIALALRIEASLSFIGVGVPPPTPTWGNMIRDGVPQLLSAPWLSVFPGLAIVVTVLAFNLIGDSVRDAIDPRTRA